MIALLDVVTELEVDVIAIIAVVAIRNVNDTNIQTSMDNGGIQVISAVMSYSQSCISYMKHPQGSYR